MVVLENCCDFDDSTHQLVDGLLADVKRRRQSMVSLWEGPSFMAEPKKILLVKPDSELTVVKRLRAFLHLEPLALEHLAGAVPAGD